MRLTTVARMTSVTGRLSTYAASTVPVAARTPPISFDQARHVGAGSRPGSWMAVALRPEPPVDHDQLAAAWHAVVARHGTLRTVVRRDPELRLEPIELSDGAWHGLDAAGREIVPEPGGTAGAGAGTPTLSVEEIRTGLRAHLDVVCDPFAAPSHRLCLIEPEDPAERPQIVVAADHAHLDAWSLLVLARDLTVCLDDVRAGRTPGAELPHAAPFAAHTAAMAERRDPPRRIIRRWREILDAGGGAMPQFPLPLGDLTTPHGEVVALRDVADAAELGLLEEAAAAQGVRLLTAAVSVLTRLAGDHGHPLRAVFPVHSRNAPRWYDSVGWFITNAVLESEDPDPQICRRAVREAIRLGAQPLEPIMRPYGGMPQTPGMFAVSWLDHRRLPIAVDDALDPQHVSAVSRTDGVMIWFVVDDAGLHLRCRHPDTPEARRHVPAWLEGIVAGMREPLGRPGNSAAPSSS
ncbi:N-acetyltransferase GCN5 [Nesterenkonia sp. F]|uniref:N-acetyltransferase GCN5 n=1 Tax=Nesterenkonia sp. F TaxID=795955 RepID=UPI000255D250|nr:N-acetyltransferase GCN5 [Nesterenkonia sp. F]